MRRITFITLTLIMLVSVGCGFHLQGFNNTDFKFPFKRVYVECNGIAICGNLKNAIRLGDLAKLVDKPESADATIALIDEQTGRQPQGFNSYGRISSYALSYQVTTQILQHGDQVGNPMIVSAHDTMQYNDATILSNNQNEATFWDQLHENATNQLVRRIVHFHAAVSAFDNTK